MIPRSSSAALLSLTVLAQACTGPPGDAGEIVQPPDLSLASPAVRGQLDAARDDAVQVVSSRAASTVERSRALGQLGEHYHAYEFHEAAIHCYEQAQRLAPGEPRWFYLEGVLKQMRGELEAADQALREARELDRRDPAIALRLGEVLLSRDEWHEAEPLLRQAARATGSEAAAEAALARLAVQRGDQEAAVRHLRRALERQPDADLLFSSLARSLRSIGRDDEAAAAAELAGSREPRRSEPVLAQVLARRHGAVHYLSRAGRQASSRDLGGAEQTYRNVLVEVPDSLEAKKGLSGVLLARGAYGEAEDLLREILARDATDTETRLQLARLLELQGNVDAALAEYGRAVEIATDKITPRLAQAAALHRAGDPLAAVRVYDAVLLAVPSERRALLGRIQALADAQRLLEARHEVDRFVHAHPEDLDARLLQGQLQARSGDLAAAESTFRSILDARNVSAATAARASHGLGNLLALQKRWNEAVTAFRKALELDPKLDPARMALDAVRAEIRVRHEPHQTPDPETP